MPHFYFDVADDGLMFADLATTCREAVRVLPGVARDVLPDGTEKVMSASVRDEAGTILFRAALLVFHCERPQPGDPA